MKATKKIVGAACALVAAVALCAGSTFAWFSANNTVSATGMSVGATAPSSLVINTDSAKLNEGKTTVAFTGANKLSPCTHYDSTAHSSVTSTTANLVCVNNPQDVDPATGLAMTGKTLTYKDAANVSGGTTYYTDFTVYIASASGADINTGKLKATVAGATGAPTGEIYNAVAVDYYVKLNASASKDDFVAGTVHMGDTTKEKDIYTLSTTNVIPAYDATSNNKYLCVVLRVYFDGAYMETGTADKTALRNTTVNTTDYGLTVNFEYSAT